MANSVDPDEAAHFEVTMIRVAMEQNQHSGMVAQERHRIA